MKLTNDNYLKARDFILTNARMIERRLFHFHFDNDKPEGVFHAVYAYRNADGGFGHGMEPDTASPESQPLFSIMALETLDEVGYLDANMILKDFMPYFESVTTDKGGIPWMKKAEEFVWSEIERIQEKHVFCNLCIPRRLMFLEHTQSKIKAQKAIEDLKRWILADGVLCKDKTDDGWGLYEKPHSLCYAPSPDSILRPIFSDEMINADLDELINRQKDDGRWDTWYGLSEGMKLEWAGIQTLWSLKVLNNYNRIDF